MSRERITCILIFAAIIFGIAVNLSDAIDATHTAIIYR